MLIATALGKADTQTLGALAMELLVSLSKAEATIVALHDAESRRIDAETLRLEAQRAADRGRQRRHRESRGVTVTDRDVTVPSPFSPTPPFSPPTSSSSSSAREAALANRLPTDAGRNALTAIMLRVADADRLAVLAEIGMILDGGRPSVPSKPETMELALCDYAANGLSDGRFNARHFRRHVQLAALPAAPNGTGQRGGGGKKPPQQFDYSQSTTDDKGVKWQN